MIINEKKFVDFGGEGKEVVTVERRQTIEMHLFKLAVVNAVEAGKDRNRTSYSHLVNELENSIVSIITCYTSLEGLANSIGLEFYGNHPDEERQRKWWEGVDGSNPMIELPILSKFNNLLREICKDNPKIQGLRSLPKELQKKIDYMTVVRNSLIHYRAEFYNQAETKKLSNDLVLTPEFETYKYETTIEFLKTYKEVVDEINKYSRKGDYGKFVDQILDEYGLAI